MKQNHTENAIDHTGGEQNTGNHKVADTAEAKGADRFGGTRTGAQNIEPSSGGGKTVDKDDADATSEQHPSKNDK